MSSPGVEVELKQTPSGAMSHGVSKFVLIFHSRGLVAFANLRAFDWVTQSKLLLELNQLKDVTSHVGITSHSAGIATPCLALRIAAPWVSDRSGRTMMASDLGDMLCDSLVVKRRGIEDWIDR